MSWIGLAIAFLVADPGPRVELAPARKTSVLLMGRCEVDVAFRLVVSDGGDEDYYCPRVQWEWEDGSFSEEEVDCPPFSEATADDHRQVWTRHRAFQKNGRYVVKARLLKAERVVRIVETTAIVTGWTGYSDARRQENGCSPARASSPEPMPTDPPRP